SGRDERPLRAFRACGAGRGLALQTPGPAQLGQTRSDTVPRDQTRTRWFEWRPTRTAPRAPVPSAARRSTPAANGVWRAARFSPRWRAIATRTATGSVYA